MGQGKAQADAEQRRRDLFGGQFRNFVQGHVLAEIGDCGVSEVPVSRSLNPGAGGVDSEAGGPQNRLSGLPE